MSEFNWCHGPSCHKSHTVDRVRGVKGSKVLRTRKVKYWSGSGIYNYFCFCSQGCMHEFVTGNIDEFIRLHPRPQALETPIHNPEKVRPYEGASWTTTEIKVDETRQT